MGLFGFGKKNTSAQMPASAPIQEPLPVDPLPPNVETEPTQLFSHEAAASPPVQAPEQDFSMPDFSDAELQTSTPPPQAPPIVEEAPPQAMPSPVQDLPPQMPEPQAQTIPDPFPQAPPVQEQVIPEPQPEPFVASPDPLAMSAVPPVVEEDLSPIHEETLVEDTAPPAEPVHEEILPEQAPPVVEEAPPTIPGPTPTPEPFQPAPVQDIPPQMSEPEPEMNFPLAGEEQPGMGFFGMSQSFEEPHEAPPKKVMPQHVVAPEPLPEQTEQPPLVEEEIAANPFQAPPQVASEPLAPPVQEQIVPEPAPEQVLTEEDAPVLSEQDLNPFPTESPIQEQTPWTPPQENIQPVMPSSESEPEPIEQNIVVQHDDDGKTNIFVEKESYENALLSLVSIEGDVRQAADHLGRVIDDEAIVSAKMKEWHDCMNEIQEKLIAADTRIFNTGDTNE